MAGAKRIIDAQLRRLLEREGKRFEFFPAVDLVERMRSDAAPVGHAGPANKEAIRFEHDPELVFHTSDIAFIRPPFPTQGRSPIRRPPAPRPRAPGLRRR